MNTLDSFLVKTKRKTDEESEALKLPQAPVIERLTPKITSNLRGSTDKSVDLNVSCHNSILIYSYFLCSAEGKSFI